MITTSKLKKSFVNSRSREFLNDNYKQRISSFENYILLIKKTIADPISITEVCIIDEKINYIEGFL